MTLILSKPDYEEAKRKAYEILSQLKPSLYPFHNSNHTFNDVMPAIEILANELSINGDGRLILRTAGLLHDTGFIEKYWDNEPNGVKIAKQCLPEAGYSKGLIEAVGDIIIATKMPQSPQASNEDLRILQEIMCDADLYNLGGESFFPLGKLLLEERKIHKKEIPSEYQPPETLKEWYERQLEFLNNHKYFTEVAQSSRNKGKEGNIRLLEEKILKNKK